jgi:hypothetical protein
MNQSRAKYIRRVAEKVLAATKYKMSDGHGLYHRDNNHIVWEPKFDENGLRVKDPEGKMLLEPVKKPGTIHCAWNYRILYKSLKKLWKDTSGKHEVFQKANAQ